MTTLLKQKLSSEDILALSSNYLQNGRKQEDWEITNLEIEGNILTANIRMRSYYTSPSDAGGFHLTIFSTLEFLSQLTILYAHVWAGLKEKTREGWMIDSAITSKNAVRNPENIQVRMEVLSIKKIGHNMIATTKSKVFDEHGSFEAKLKGFLS